MTTGVFITLEGGEGAGKSTQLKLLEERLATHEINIVRTREPGGVPSAETIRDLLVNGETDKWRPLTETLLHFAARHEHISRLVQPALENGQWVLCDLETIATLYRLAVGKLEPNLTIILDLPVQVGLERAEDRGIGGTRYERMGIEFHQRLRDGFLQIAANNPHRCSIVDATQTIEEISENIMALVEARFLSSRSKGKPI
jgi:dTMP kinase